ncbi:TPA: ParB family protein [Escherichia coli]
MPVVNELSLTDYQALLQIAEDAKTKGVSMSELAEKVSSRIAEHESTNVDKTKIMAIYKDESKNLKPAPVMTLTY